MRIKPSSSACVKPASTKASTALQKYETHRKDGKGVLESLALIDPLFRDQSPLKTRSLPSSPRSESPVTKDAHNSAGVLAMSQDKLGIVPVPIQGGNEKKSSVPSSGGTTRPGATAPIITAKKALETIRKKLKKNSNISPKELTKILGVSVSQAMKDAAASVSATSRQLQHNREKVAASGIGKAQTALTDGHHKLSIKKSTEVIVFTEAFNANTAGD